MTQAIQTIKKPIQANIVIPGSRNLTYRALLLAALANGVSEISGIAMSSSIRAFINALSQLGIVTQLDETSRSCIIAGGNGAFPKKQATLCCDDLSTMIYLLAAACAISSGIYYFDGAVKQRKKSMAALLHLLRLQGIQSIPNDAQYLPFSLIGADSLEGREILVTRTLKNHLISALLIIAPFARSPFTFTLEDGVNQSYIDMTCAMMAEFGVLVHRVHQNQLLVPVPQRYQAKDYVIEPDLGLASYLFAAAAITGGEITIQSFKRASSKQPQIKFLSLLEKMGCPILETTTGLTVKAPQNLEGLEVSMRKFSEPFFALCAMAPFAKSPTKILHLDPIKKKESQYLAILKEAFTKMDIRVEIGADWIKIFPGIPKGHVLISAHQPHIAMAFAVIGLKIPDVTVDTECIMDQHPEFFKLCQHLINPSSMHV